MCGLAGLPLRRVWPGSVQVLELLTGLGRHLCGISAAIQLLPPKRAQAHGSGSAVCVAVGFR